MLKFKNSLYGQYKRDILGFDKEVPPPLNSETYRYLKWIRNLHGTSILGTANSQKKL